MQGRASNIHKNQKWGVCAFLFGFWFFDLIKEKTQLASGGGPYGFSLASSLIMSSGFLPRRVDNT